MIFGVLELFLAAFLAYAKISFVNREYPPLWLRVVITALVHTGCITVIVLLVIHGLHLISAGL